MGIDTLTTYLIKESPEETIVRTDRALGQTWRAIKYSTPDDTWLRLVSLTPGVDYYSTITRQSDMRYTVRTREVYNGSSYLGHIYQGYPASVPQEMIEFIKRTILEPKA